MFLLYFLYKEPPIPSIFSSCFHSGPTISKGLSSIDLVCLSRGLPARPSLGARVCHVSCHPLTTSPPTTLKWRRSRVSGDRETRRVNKHTSPLVSARALRANSHSGRYCFVGPGRCHCIADTTTSSSSANIHYVVGHYVVTVYDYVFLTLWIFLTCVGKMVVMS